MEDAAKAIELSVGVIMFIIALTIAIMLYNKLANTAENVLTINNTQNNITYNENAIKKDFGFIYTKKDVLELVDDIKSGNDLYYDDEGKLKLIIIIGQGYTTTNDIEATFVYDMGKDKKENEAIKTYDFASKLGEGKYKIVYKYAYNKNDVNVELNQHKPKEIQIIKYKE